MPREPESPSELRAREVLEPVLGFPLRRFAPGVEHTGRLSPDYEDDSGAAYEVKEVTSEVFRELAALVRRERFRASVGLTSRWRVVIPAPTLDDRFRPTPSYPAETPERIAALEADGFTVTRNAAREAAWRESHSGRERRKLRLRHLAADIEPDLEILEQAGILNTREGHATSEKESMALARVRKRTRGAICIGQHPCGEPPGVELVFGYGYSRTGADDFAYRVQAWLDSHLSANLRGSLWPQATRRHGVLVFDSTEPAFSSMRRHASQSPAPLIDLDLPPEIDVLWCLLSQSVLQFEQGCGWKTVAVAGATA